MFLHNSFSPTSFAPISWAPADESWVPEEELRPEYRGNGGHVAGLPRQQHRRQFDDATEQDIRDLVEARWDIEQLRQQRQAQPSDKGPAPNSPSLVPKVAPDPAGQSASATETRRAPAMDSAPSAEETRRRNNAKAIAMAIALAEMD